MEDRGSILPPIRAKSPGRASRKAFVADKSSPGHSPHVPTSQFFQGGEALPPIGRSALPTSPSAGAAFMSAHSSRGRAEKIAHDHGQKKEVAHARKKLSVLSQRAREPIKQKLNR